MIKLTKKKQNKEQMKRNLSFTMFVLMMTFMVISVVIVQGVVNNECEFGFSGEFSGITVGEFPSENSGLDISVEDGGFSGSMYVKMPCWQLAQLTRQMGD